MFVVLVDELLDVPDQLEIRYPLEGDAVNEITCPLT
ncbi:hypothetical protein SDC9_66926 [bioreactor metagenome]|uniref:Uncharacterized protein n=1 Tax=bioreactor metagenome TaxID=1076179 RepID=A0A644XW75_9ZZZZ